MSQVTHYFICKPLCISNNLDLKRSTCDHEQKSVETAALFSVRVLVLT